MSNHRWDKTHFIGDGLSEDGFITLLQEWTCHICGQKVIVPEEDTPPKIAGICVDKRKDMMALETLKNELRHDQRRRNGNRT